ncbi:UNVERIFIED_CONTAM: hypothetical protein Sradi_7289100, partial [Sesamum radiatum]
SRNHPGIYVLWCRIARKYGVVCKMWSSLLDFGRSMQPWTNLPMLLLGSHFAIF